MLYQLSYASLERETGIEPATNSLEGCDSTIELLPLLPYCTGTPHYCEPRERTITFSV